MADEKIKEKKNPKFSFRKLLYNDKYLIVISLVLAIVVWVVVSINLSPQTTKTITVPLTIDFSDTAAEQLGLKSYGEENINVDVSVSCKKYMAMDITSDDLSVTLQTNAVTSKGNIDVPIKVEAKDDNAEFTIESYYPMTYSAYFDVEQEKTMDITLDYQYDDYVADGYVSGESVLSQTTATITGPASYINNADEVVATVPVEKNLKETQSYDVTAKAVDSKGNIVDYVSVDTGKDNLTVSIPILKKETLKTNVTFTNIPEGISTDDLDITYSQDTVDAAVLEDANVTQANIGNIDFSELNAGTNEFKFDVSNLENIVIRDKISKIKVTVEVPSKFTSEEVSIDASTVEVSNLPDGYKATVISVSPSSATLVGESTDLDEDVTVDMIVDMSSYKDDLKVGQSTYKISAITDASKTSWVYGTYEATVLIEKAQ